MKISLDDWNGSPVLTTIDSFSVPVTEIGFPSVTVCSDSSSGPLDPLNYIERLLNHVDIYNTGNDSEIGKRLNWLYEMFRLESFNQMKEAAESFDLNVSVDEDKALNLASLLQEGVMSVDQVWSRVGDEFGVRLSFDEFWDMMLYEIDPERKYMFLCMQEESCPDEFENATAIIAELERIFPGQYADLFGVGTLTAEMIPTVGMAQAFVYAIQRNQYMCMMWEWDQDYKQVQSLLRELAEDAGVGSSTTLFEIVSAVSKKAPWSNVPFSYCNKVEDLFQDEHECSSVWNDFYSQDINQINKTCFNFWTEDFQDKLPEVMKIMKFAGHGRTSSINTTHLLQAHVATTFSRLRYKDLEFPDPERVFDPLSLIPDCAYKLRSGSGSEGREFRCNLFRPMPTDRGICHTFNGDNFDQIYKASGFTSSLSKAYLDDIMVTADSVDRSNTDSHNHHLKFWLDNQGQFVRGKRLHVTRPDYYVGIGGRQNAFNSNQKSTRIRPGYKTIIKVTPYQVLASDGFDKLTMNERKCAFPNEIKLKMFSNYSQEACQFECGLEEARRVCGCTPWDLPFGPGEEPKMCDLFGYSCTQSVLTGLDLTLTCQSCIQNCNELTFSVVEKEMPLNPDLSCRIDSGVKAYVDKKLDTVFSGYLQTTRPLLSSKNSWDDFKTDVCTRAFREDLAVVQVEFASSKFTRAKQSVAMTLGDKIANLGKNDFYNVWSTSKEDSHQKIVKRLKLRS